MLAVYKYPVPVNDTFIIDMPEDGKLLTVDMQHGQPQLWALVDSSRKKVPRHFRLAGTGHPIDDREPLEYVNTFQVDGGSLIFHLFEIKV